ncbi:DUF4040 family protein [Nocardiopsis ansamitocini]|uniref:Monovalent cation/H+ antiporter subunit A n=1 Tax=Nocardiopsis ansamitocini TaxID=1670832 RepID=A0A9W6P633_9ACTN|nr:DUF4040 family protein [Nocardiopsis ansamitocini]GLU47816.1 monovalent cation/H+ antiporter subunit A [Nocardiopsis ansamitocini]
MVLPLVIAVLAVAASSTPLLDRVLGRAAGWPLAAVFAVLFGVVAAQAPLVLAGGVVEFSRPWMPAIGVGFHLVLDATAWLFCMLVLGVGALVMAYSARYFPSGSRTGFYLLMTAFAAAMLGLVLADDVVLLFVFWELTTICSFYLIGLSGPAAHRPAVRTFLLTALGGLALLTAAVLLMVRTGTSRVSTILTDTTWTTDPVFTSVVALLLVVAVFTKSAQFPFHYWLPDAMAASTPVSAYLHAAAMVKAGIYVLMRFSPAFGSVPVWNAMLIGFGLLTAVIGALFALRRHDLKELLAYSTVSQLGFLVAVIGVGTPAALAAAAVHTLAHALFKAALFMLVGVIDTHNGTRDIRELRGLRGRMPVTAALTVLAAASMAGIPPLLGFVSKESVFAALLDAPGAAWTGVAAAAVAVAAAGLTVAYAVRIVLGAFGGPTGQGPREEPSAAFLSAPALAALGGLGLGLAAPLLSPVVDRVAEDSTHRRVASDLALWHGFTPELLMSALAVSIGAFLAWRGAHVHRLLSRRPLPVAGITVFEALHRGVIASGVRVGAITRTDSPGAHLAVPLVVVGVLAAAVLSSAPVLPPLPSAATRPLDWLLVALTVVSVAGAVTRASRLAALVLVGAAGFTVALWFFFLGAFDVALTQLLVEVLTVVVAVLVLRRLPRRFHPVSRGRKGIAALIALVAGVSAALAAYALTGRRDISTAAQYFLDEAENETGGTNVVNTILVDFRALDTLGELTVLGVAGLVIISVLNSSGLTPGRLPSTVRSFTGTAVHPAGDNSLLVRTVGRLLIPLLVIWSVYLLLRGHNEPGGGFISALVGGSGFALAYLMAPDAARAPVRWPYPLLIAVGILIAVATGFAGYADGSFLRPLHADIWLPGGGFHFTTALVFDVGVYLAVVGVLLTALNRLGTEDDIVPGPQADLLPSAPSQAASETAAPTDPVTGGTR